jgi:hypothetical protein
MLNKHFFKLLVAFVAMLLLGILVLFAINEFGDPTVSTEDFKQTN